jgi:hypothetical protein
LLAVVCSAAGGVGFDGEAFVPVRGVDVEVARFDAADQGRFENLCAIALLDLSEAQAVALGAAAVMAVLELDQLIMTARPARVSWRAALSSDSRTVRRKPWWKELRPAALYPPKPTMTGSRDISRELLQIVRPVLAG